jgi:hypothetical protein
MLLPQSTSLIQYIQSCPFELSAHFIRGSESVDRQTPLVTDGFLKLGRGGTDNAYFSFDLFMISPPLVLASRVQTCPKPVSTLDPFPIQISTSDTSVRGK